MFRAINAAAELLLNKIKLLTSYIKAKVDPQQP